MRVIKLAVVLCFTAALVMLVNYPHPVTAQGVAAKTMRTGETRMCGGCHEDRPPLPLRTKM
jgi:hypothetical protein